SSKRSRLNMLKSLTQFIHPLKSVVFLRDSYKVIKQSWLKLGFPWFYGCNILRGLDVLTKLGYVKDERLNDAVEILLQKRQNNGTWILESTPIGRMQTNIEAKGKPSKWITLLALRILKRLSLVKSRL
ncbi:MAG: hypothetical protein QMD23_07695, partial [Candidatus Bathyarchaeia archaeon]|nr:hypothetical protein [Candidatus Bathyarchaeia archaeon]